MKIISLTKTHIFYLCILQSACVDKVNEARASKPNEPIELGVSSKEEKHSFKNKNEKGTCLGLKKNSPPIWLEKNEMVVTRFLDMCTTNYGGKGYQSESPWVAMGFPCTGGGGRVEYAGYYFAPKMVSLILSTDCLMNPPIADVMEIGKEALFLSNNAKLMAFNPFAVQYWELPGYEDADVGYKVELRTINTRNKLWNDFRNNIPIKVNLYGRENAWTSGDHFYFVDADIIRTDKEIFKLKVNKVETLDNKALKLVRDRCEALQPSRDCTSIFR